MISILHPSRGRAQKSFETIKRWIQKAGNAAVEVIISLDSDDPYSAAYQELFLKAPFTLTLMINENKGAVEAINRAARIAQGDIMIVVSDDTDCLSAWPHRILKYTEGKRDWVLKVRDGIQPKMITQPILDRIYYQRFGYIYNPIYSHCWADREFTEVAHKLKRVITKNILFRHNHYSVSKTKKRDEHYARTDATFNNGKKLFLERQKLNFGL